MYNQMQCLFSEQQYSKFTDRNAGKHQTSFSKEKWNKCYKNEMLCEILPHM